MQRETRVSKTLYSFPANPVSVQYQEKFTTSAGASTWECIGVAEFNYNDQMDGIRIIESGNDPWTVRLKTVNAVLVIPGKTYRMVLFYTVQDADPVDIIALRALEWLADWRSHFDCVADCQIGSFEMSIILKHPNRLFPVEFRGFPDHFRRLSIILSRVFFEFLVNRLPAASE